MYNRSKYWVLFMLGCLLACIVMAFAFPAEQRIDDLRPKVEACYPITKNYCWKYTKFADTNDYSYYKDVYEASK